MQEDQFRPGSAPASTRRDFIRNSSLAATIGSAAVASAKSQAVKPGVTARSASRVIGANDRINVSLIGVGSIGTAHLRTLMPQVEEDKDIQMVAVSELYTQRKERARTITKLGGEGHPSRLRRHAGAQRRGRCDDRHSRPLARQDGPGRPGGGQGCLPAKAHDLHRRGGAPDRRRGARNSTALFRSASRAPPIPATRSRRKLSTRARSANC